MNPRGVLNPYVCTPSPLSLPLDARAAQCKRAVDYIGAHLGCTLRELFTGADFGSASKVDSEMVGKFGYGGDASGGACLASMARAVSR